MSLVWKLDPTQYSPDGTVPLYQGDDWQLFGKIVDFIRGYEQPVDTSAFSVTGYFPSASGGPDLPFPGATGTCGVLSVSVPAASSPLVAPSTGGSSAYVVVTDVNTGLQQTIPTIDESVVVLQRGWMP